nr:hypothetical protein [Tanacetum cinerariifolium]
MSTQQDIYPAGFENRPPMGNKDNYVLWPSRLLRYAKSKPNGKLIYNFIMNGPYVRRIIPDPGDPDRGVPVAETFHEQTDDELIEKEVKQMEANDLAIQIILVGLPEDIYAAVVHNAVQNPSLQNVGSQNGLIVVSGIVNQNLNRNGNVVAARAEGNSNGNNGNQIRCYNCRGLGTQTDKAPVYDSDGSAEYTELLEPISKPHQVQQNDSNVIFEVPSVEQGRGTVKQHPATVEETRAYFESLYNNLAIKVEKVNMANRKLRETNADLTTELARYKNQE